MKLYQKKLKEFKNKGYKIVSNKEKMKKPLLRELKVEVKGGRKLTYIYYFNKQTKEEWFKNISLVKAKEMIKKVKLTKERVKVVKKINNKNKFEPLIKAYGSFKEKRTIKRLREKEKQQIEKAKELKERFQSNG